MIRPAPRFVSESGTGALPNVRMGVWAGFAGVLAAAFVLELSLGSVLMPVKTVAAILLGHKNVPEGWREIVLLFRLPRAVTAMLAGAALSISGLKMQTLFRNPLADPFVLGISAGANLGVALVIMAAGGLELNILVEKTGVTGNVSLILAATLGAVVVLALVLGIAGKVESNVTLLIIGLMFGYISGSLVQILMQFTREHQMQSYIVWTFGSFGSVTWRQMTAFAPTVITGLALAWILAKPLNAFLLGEGYARSMGVNVRNARILIVFGSSLLAGTVTAYCGPIGFLGIAVPHLCRLLLRTSDHHVLVPAAILLGAALALVADLISQVPGTKIVLPLNAVTALIGAPVVVGMILRRRHVMES
ncbi:MAG: iron chelate uptake ABC transporter family permease subunit [Desulfomonilaceae bacterium]